MDSDAEGETSIGCEKTKLFVRNDEETEDETAFASIDVVTRETDEDCIGGRRGGRRRRRR